MVVCHVRSTTLPVALAHGLGDLVYVIPSIFVSSQIVS
jgi:hypothetical protein